MKCDAGVPSCNRCQTDGRECSYIKSRRGWKGTRRKKAAAAAAAAVASKEESKPAGDEPGSSSAVEVKKAEEKQGNGNNEGKVPIFSIYSFPYVGEPLIVSLLQCLVFESFKFLCFGRTHTNTFYFFFFFFTPLNFQAVFYGCGYSFFFSSFLSNFILPRKYRGVGAHGLVAFP